VASRAATRDGVLVGEEVDGDIGELRELRGWEREMRAASTEEKRWRMGGSHREAARAVVLPHQKPAWWASTDAWGWGRASPVKEGGGSVLGRG
jgi:hypothetical protein